MTPGRGVVVVGDVVTDILAVHREPLATGSDTAARVRITGGGSAANTAAWLAAAGTDPTIVGVVGDDEPGRARIDELRAAGVRCAVRIAPGVATGSVVVLSDGADRTMLSDRGANTLLVPSDVDDAMTGAAHLHLSGYTLFDPATAPAGRHALVAARARGLTSSVDAGSAAPLTRLGPALFLDGVRGTNLLFANLDEARVLVGRDGTPEFLASALSEYAEMIVVKCGAGGAVLADRDGALARPVPATEVLDATGAGDAFAAGFLAAWLGGAAPAQALDAGGRLGARAVGVIGGRPGTGRA